MSSSDFPASPDSVSKTQFPVLLAPTAMTAPAATMTGTAHRPTPALRLHTAEASEADYRAQKRGQEPIAKWPEGCSALLVPDPFLNLTPFLNP